VPFCVSCNADLLIDEARFCPLCGTQQPEHPAGGESSSHIASSTLDSSPSNGWEAGSDLPPGAGSQSAGEPESGEESAEKDGAAPGQGTVVGLDAIARASKRLASSYNAGLWRLAIGDLVVAFGCAVLVGSLFLPWFTQVNKFRVAVHRVPRLPHHKTHVVVVRTTIDAIGAGAWRWMVVVLAAAVLLYIGLRILPGRTVRLPLPHWQLLAVAGAVLLWLTVMSIALPPDIRSWSLQPGAFVGLGAILVVAGGVIVRRSEAEVIAAPSGNWFVRQRIAHLQEKRQRAAAAEAAEAARAAEKAARDEAEAQAAAAALLATRRTSTRKPPEPITARAPQPARWDDATHHVQPATVRVHPPEPDAAASAAGAGLAAGTAAASGLGAAALAPAAPPPAGTAPPVEPALAAPPFEPAAPPAPGPPLPPDESTTVVRVVGAGGGSGAPPVFIAPRPGEEVHVTRLSPAVPAGRAGDEPERPARSAPLAGVVASTRNAADKTAARPPSDPAPAAAKVSPQPEKPQAVDCGVCGTVNLPSARACRTCGVMLTQKHPRR
jgi:hypothetical protein